MGPVAMLRPPPGTSSQTQPDGRSVYSVPLGQDSGGSGAAHYIHSGGAKFIWNEKELITRLLFPP